MLPEKCNGCEKIKDGECTVYNEPEKKIKVGGCFFSLKNVIIDNDNKKNKKNVTRGGLKHSIRTAPVIISKKRKMKKGK